MKHFYRGCAGIVLTLALSVPVFAGQIPCGGITEPPPPETAEATTEADGQMSTGVVEAAMTLLQSVLFML
jgi:hypothetical protein